MANTDIQFTSEIKLDTEQAKRSIADLSRQINDVFNKTGMMMSAALRTKNFGFSEYVNSYSTGLDEAKKIYQEHVKALPSLPKKPTKAQKAFYASKLKELGLADAALTRLTHLSAYMGKLSKYDTLYGDISTLQDITAHDRIDPATGLGKYGTLQRYANRFLGTLYAGNYMFPNIVGRGALELGEYYRDINRKTGSMNRSALRYIQDKTYSAASLSRAGDFMLMTGEGGLGLLSDIYGLGLGTDAKNIPSRVSTKARDALGSWSAAGLSAQAHKEALLGGGLSKGEYAYHLAGYKEDMRLFIKLQQKLFPEEKEIAENLKKLNKSDIVNFGKYGATGISPIWMALGGKVAKDVFGTASGMLESYWGESITRNAYASREAQLSRITSGSRVLGSVIGGILGALTGNSALAGAGYAAGGEISSLFGKFEQTMFKSDIKSSTDMMSRIRNKALYGSSYNTYFANAITNTGIANGEAAMGGLADRAMSLRGRMMLGQVGEQEMLYYNMMPNYYAALMSGITGPELMNVYQKDLNAIGDPSMRYVVAQSIGNTDAFAMSRSGYFGSLYKTAGAASAGYEKTVGALEPGFYAGRETAAMETMERDASEIVKSAQRGNGLIYQGGATSAVYQAFQDVMGWLKSTNIQFVNNIRLPDGDLIQRDVKTADELYTDSWSQIAGV